MSKQYIIKNGKAVRVLDEAYKILKKPDCRIRRFEKDPKKTRYIINQRRSKTP